MARISSRISLQDIAEALGVNRSTVSLALRDDPRLPEATRQRVKQAAAEIGYKANPLVSAWLQQVRSSGAASMGASLAFVLCNTPHNLIAAPIYQAMLSGARQEAQALGYSVAEFDIPCTELHAERIARILKARGMRGVLLFDPSASITAEQIGFLERDFATVVLLRCGVEQRFHTVTVDLAWNLALALKKLTEQGCRRVALGICPSDTRYALTRVLMPEYLYYQSTIPAEERVPPMPPETLNNSAVFRKWLREGRADALIAVRTGDYQFVTEPDGLPPIKLAFTLLGTESSQATPQVVTFNPYAQPSLPASPTPGTHKVPKLPRFAGIENQAAEIGKAATALLSQQVTQNRFGTPDHPLEIRIKGRWVEERSPTTMGG